MLEVIEQGKNKQNEQTNEKLGAKASQREGRSLDSIKHFSGYGWKRTISVQRADIENNNNLHMSLRRV